MAQTFFTLNNGTPRAIMGIRRRSDGTPQSLGDAIPDGDTLGVQLAGTGAVRFLGIDTPEKSFEHPLDGPQRLDGAPWEQFLSDPFAPGLPAAALEPSLIQHLRARVGPGAAANHHRHAVAGGDALRTLVQSDLTAMAQTPEQFSFFLSFSYEVFDRYGRFLAFINRNQPSATTPGPRPLTYNERMLELGRALPYIIWPNVTPFRDAASAAHAVLAPGTAKRVAEQGALKRARDLVMAARAAGAGVFDPADPLRLEAFEIRYLGRGEVPTRAVIDLRSDDDVLLRPQSYIKIPHPEDRLFVPSEFVPLFAARGWRLEGFA